MNKNTIKPSPDTLTAFLQPLNPTVDTKKRTAVCDTKWCLSCAFTFTEVRTIIFQNTLCCVTHKSCIPALCLVMYVKVVVYDFECNNWHLLWPTLFDDSPMCVRCLNKNETASHIPRDHEAIAYWRFHHMGHYLMQPGDCVAAPLSKVLYFVWILGLLGGWKQGGTQ
jgi:hypothetical protein